MALVAVAHKYLVPESFVVSGAFIKVNGRDAVHVVSGGNVGAGVAGTADLHPEVMA